MAQQIIYSDLNLGLLNPEQEILKNEDAIKQQLLLRFTFVVGSRVMRRRFGSRLEEILFEPIDDQTSQDVRREIINLAGTDGRLVVRQNIVVPDVDNQQYYVDFNFYCPALRVEFNLNFNLARSGQYG
jgi:phage baseplate assembly protein W